MRSAGFVDPGGVAIVITFRAAPDGERMGMDLHELGAGAYPEFVIHRDEFNPR